MAAGTVYLIRRTNGTFAKYADALSVSLTGQTAAYGSVSGSATADTITVPGSAFLVGYSVTFTSLLPGEGAGLTTGVKYYIVNVSGTSYKLATNQSGSVIDITTDITVAAILVQTDELLVWSTEYRDIFAGLGVQGASEPKSQSGVSYNAPFGAPQGYGIYADPNQGITTELVASGIGSVAYLAGQPKATVSDEVGHNPLRQTFLPRTHWKFTMSTGPSPLYATWADGDIIANNPPNT